MLIFSYVIKHISTNMNKILYKLFYVLLGRCPCDATEHKLRVSNGLRALATGGVNTMVSARALRQK
jgi:hypothetical protein